MGDLDGDGRPEIVIVNMNAAPSLLKNDSPGGHYLNVVLTGTRSNKSAIGARVTVSAGGRKRIDEVMSGGSYYSQNSFVLHFGLGEATAVDSIEIHGLAGRVQSMGKTTADQTLRSCRSREAAGSSEAQVIRVRMSVREMGVSSVFPRANCGTYRHDFRVVLEPARNEARSEPGEPLLINPGIIRAHIAVNQ